MELFFKEKSKTSENIINLINHFKACEKVTAKKIQCDKARENKTLRNNTMRGGLGVNFQFTAPYTLQKNGTIECSFATSYGRIRAILNTTGIHDTLRSFLWAELENENATDNVLIKGKNSSSPHKRFFGRQPGYQDHLR